jgi:hypothetical protein
MLALVLVGVVGAILASQVRCRKTSDSYLGWSKTLPLLTSLSSKCFSENPFDYVGGYVQSASLFKDLLVPTCFIPIVRICFLFLQPTPIDVAGSVATLQE